MSDAHPPKVTPTTDELIARYLQGLRFGEVVIHVHDGRIVQIERTDRIRPAIPPAVT